MSERLWYALKGMLLGAVIFWTPDVVLHAIRRDRFGGRDIVLLTVLLPLALLAVYLVLKKRHGNDTSRPIGWPLLLGAWLLGGPFMVAGATFGGGGFLGPDGVAGGIKMMLIAVVPIFTTDMATYDGSLGALFVVSIAAILVAAWDLAVVGKSRRLP